MQVLFISTMAGSPWGGSEELWSRTAARLASQGLGVSASVQGWPKLDSRILSLSTAGVLVRPRPHKASIATHARRYISGQPKIVLDIERAFGRASPNLVVVSDGGPLPPIELIETCLRKNWPFVILANVNFDSLWFSDELAARYRRAVPLARSCFFVSEENRRLTEFQLGHSFDNAEVVQNPLTIDIDGHIPWPEPPASSHLRMACVARLDLSSKGQDILLQVLATPLWAAREWSLTFYGNGPHRDILQRLILRLGLSKRVKLAGYLEVDKIWLDNHVLVIPSRGEGVPMVTVEAMGKCRPVVATNVGANAQLIDDDVTGFLAQSASITALAEALERMWRQRGHLQNMGKAAEVRIRGYLLKDPVGVFADKIKSLACV